MTNVEQVRTAPVTAIIACDLHFYEQLPKLFPHAPGWSPEFAEVTARRNSSLQGAYLIVAARALGLDCGPLSGLDSTKVDEESFGAGKNVDDCDQEFFPLTHVRTNFLCSIWYGDRSQLHPRNLRLSFEEACVVL